MPITDNKVRENRLRRKAERLGLWLEKSRARLLSVDNYQGYRILDRDKAIVIGAKFGLDIDAVEKFLDEKEQELIEARTPKI
jgi:hypothetical protein